MANYSVTGTLGVQRTCIAQVGSAVAALLLAACGGGPVCTNTSTATCIGASGGTVSGPKGATVTIPDGVLPTFTTVIAIGVQPDATNSPSLPAGTSAAGLVWQLLPHGTTFTSPVTLTLPFDPTAPPAGLAPRLFKAKLGGAYAEVTPITVNGNFITAQVSSFSYFAIITNKLPTAVLTLPTGDTQTAQVLRFAATGSSDVEGALANYRWDFGDGSAAQEGATLLNPTHTFATVGNYTVSLTVTDALGASNTTQSSISIAPICTAPQFLRRGECVSPALTDTGTTASQCYAAGSNVLTSCTSAAASALNASQDGMLGTDVTMPDAADGKLGLSYSTVPNPA
ncbi:MAG: PKD domain-containing protein, partial [Rhodoferax sp.]|nr:PKD domain-containing protein [Rhodoferax sp.]